MRRDERKDTRQTRDEKNERKMRWDAGRRFKKLEEENNGDARQEIVFKKRYERENWNNMGKWDERDERDDRD